MKKNKVVKLVTYVGVILTLWAVSPLLSKFIDRVYFGSPEVLATSQVSGSTQSPLGADYPQTIPVVSIVIDPILLTRLHDYPEEHNQNEDQPITLEYFAPGGQVQFKIKAGMRIYGDQAELYGPKKSYQISFDQAFEGPGRLEYRLFEDTPVQQFDKVVLRAVNNETSPALLKADPSSTQTYFIKFIGDQVMRNLHRDMGQPVVHGRWVLLTINGQFRGLYNLTESVDLSYFQSYSARDAAWEAISQETTRTVDGEWIRQEIVAAGTGETWQAIQNWAGSADFTDPSNVTALESRVDLENLFSAMFLQAYGQAYDWPGNNLTVYRRNDAGATDTEAKWRVLLEETEDSFGSSSDGFRTDLNTLEQIFSSNEGMTGIFATSIKDNCQLKRHFDQRVREYLGVENPFGKPESEIGQFSKERVKAEILKQAAEVRPYIPMEIERWAGDLSLDMFDQNIQNALLFVDQREAVILHHLDGLKSQTSTNCQ